MPIVQNLTSKCLAPISKKEEGRESFNQLACGRLVNEKVMERTYALPPVCTPGKTGQFPPRHLMNYPWTKEPIGC